MLGILKTSNVEGLQLPTEAPRSLQVIEETQVAKGDEFHAQKINWSKYTGFPREFTGMVINLSIKDLSWNHRMIRCFHPFFAAFGDGSRHPFTDACSIIGTSGMDLLPEKLLACMSTSLVEATRASNPESNKADLDKSIWNLCELCYALGILWHGLLWYMAWYGVCFLGTPIWTKWIPSILGPPFECTPVLGEAALSSAPARFR